MDANESAGATPVVPGATPGQSDQPAPAAVPAPATGDQDGLGDAGKRAIEAERKAAREALKRAEAAEKELETLRTGQLSEHEKAIAAARKEATDEATGRAHAMVRRAEVRRALASAGVTPDSLDLAAGAPEFAALAVDDDGQITDLEKSVTSFRTAHPSLFALVRGTAGNFDGGPSGGRAALPTFTRAQLSDATFYRAHRDEILAAQREGRITG